MQRSQDGEPFVTDPDEWDGRAELAIGLFLRSYLEENPAPAGIVLARDIWRLGART